MATLLLGAAGGALGGVFGPLGALAGKAVGTLLGGFADRAIANALTPAQRVQGPRLTTSDIQTSTEGAIIDRIFGRARISGEIIWATRFEEVVATEESGGKGSMPTVKTTTYSYFGNFAVGLCEGVIAGIGRIWADGAEIDQDLVDFRVYRGGEAQGVDPLIEAKEGDAPAYRGLAYVVFERLALEAYGNRLPQISVEVYRPTGALEAIVPGVAIIGGNEFGYDTTLVTVDAEDGGVDENRHTLAGPTDWHVTIDRLDMLMPSARAVMLIVPWFGDDLRCGVCSVRPKVDSATKNTKPYQWSVGSLTRASARTTSQIDGSAAYGGTPSDASVIRAIRHLNARGFTVTLCPFLMMDVPSGNVQPNPYSNGAGAVGQPAYPWRGRITCSPAAGFSGTVDRSAAAGTQVSAFLGTAAPGHFGGADIGVTYTGPAEWSYRRFILHCAQLAKLAGGVESFLIGSEMVGLSQVRSSATAYPFVAGLKTLAADVSTMLGGSVKVSYAADWTEYSGHRPGDGSNDVTFHLDPLWSDAHIDFVGIDHYFPLADWRDGSAHLDFDPAGPTSIYDRTYLQSQIEGGEGYDWYYGSAADRDNQVRTPIIDTAKGKHWVFRAKDVRSWWANAHYNRPGGVESAVATAWVPQSKPIRFVEMGCPAVDKGANQPNVFVDPKSSESVLPHYSSGARDDGMQRAHLDALIGYYGLAANNPLSTVYSGRMLDVAHSHVWCWDARPWPSFDLDAGWGDSGNWFQGHWLTGRMGGAPAAETIAAILDDAGFADYAVDPIATSVDGVTTGAVTSARETLDALRPVYQFDGVESGGVIRFFSRLGRAPVAAIDVGDLVIEDGSTRRYRETRAQETDLPEVVKLSYGDPARDDQTAGTEARRPTGGSLRALTYSAPVTMPESVARAVCEWELHAAWTARERTAFRLPPRFLALDAGDIVDFRPTRKLLRLSELTDGTDRAAEAYRVEPLATGPIRLPHSGGRAVTRVRKLDARVIFIDGPLLQDDDVGHAGYVGGVMLPFGRGIAVHRSPMASAFALDTILTAAATTGVTTEAFGSGPAGRWDRRTMLKVRLVRGALASHSESVVLNGGNPILVENQDGEWELLQFATATMTGDKTYTLSDLLRGQRGSEHAMRDPVPVGARVIVPNSAIRSTSLTPALVGLPLTWRSGPADRDIGNVAYQQTVFAMRGKGLRPLSPVHLRAVTVGSGDVRLTWIRRTRIGGDSWEQLEVPLGEEAERYDVEILSAGGAVLRTVAALGSPTLLYTAAQQVSDFGTTQKSLRWRVFQVSATFGRGMPGSSED